MSEEDAGLAIVPLGDGRYQVRRGETRRVAYAVAAHDTWVFLDGRVYVLGERTGTASRPRTELSHELTAPMPATVLAIHASPGQRVARNDVLIVLEAMKMELPIRSPRDGTVARVTCSVGELVQPGATLMELDDPGDRGGSPADGNERMAP